jgi:hypothetical protein
MLRCQPVKEVFSPGSAPNAKCMSPAVTFWSPVALVCSTLPLKTYREANQSEEHHRRYLHLHSPNPRYLGSPHARETQARCSRHLQFRYHGYPNLDFLGLRLGQDARSSNFPCPRDQYHHLLH